MTLQYVLFCVACFLFAPLWSALAADLMDDYLSVPGSYVFIQREPEGARSDRLVLTVFEDFMCPACYHAAIKIFPSLKEKYGNRLELRFLGFPFVHQESRLAARAHVVAQELGFGDEMQKALFRAHFEQQLDITSKEGLAKVADSIGLASDLLLKQLDDNGGAAEVERTIAQADSYQIDGTPTVILDGWIKVNDVNQGNLEKIIDGLLEKKKLNARNSAPSPRP